MLNFFRGGGTGQAVIGVVVMLIIVAFVVEFRAGGRGTSSITVKCSVKAAGYCVTGKEYEAAFRLAARDLEPKEARRLEVGRRVADGLVERELLHAEATRLGIGIGNDEVMDELVAGRARISLPVAQARELSQMLHLCNLVANPFYPDPRRAPPVCAPNSPLGIRSLPVKSAKTNAFDYDLYVRNLRVFTNRSPKEFRATQRRELIAERMRQLVRSYVQVSEAETFAAYEREESKATARVAKLDRNWFAKYVVEVTPALVDDWSAANTAQVDQAWKTASEQWKAECPLVAEIRASFPPNATEADKTITRGKIDGAKARLDAGEDFATVARELSDGQTALAGGAVGCLTTTAYGEGGDRLLEAVATLKPGELTPVIETTVGFHLVRFDGNLKAEAVEATGKRQIATMLFVRFKADGAARQLADDLITRVKAGGDLATVTPEATRALLAQARKLDLAKAKPEQLVGLDAPDAPRIETTEPFTRYGYPVPGADPKTNLAALLFALDRPGAVHPSPVQTFNGYAVATLVEKRLAKREEFAKRRVELMRERQRVKADEALAEYVAALRKAGTEGIKIDEELFKEPAGADEG